jgi:hypothetical protein
MEKLTLCIPSRGLLHSRTIEAVDKALIYSGYQLRDLGLTWDRYISNDKPIPDAQNYVIEQALFSGADFIWMIEEDIKPEENTLSVLWEELQRLGLDFIAAKYKLKSLQDSFALSSAGKMLYSGIGCCLMRATLFNSLQRPWFQTNKNYTYTSDSEVLKQSGPRFESEYGGQDIDFFAKLNNAKVKFGLSDHWVKHLVVKEYGQPNTNQGCHLILEV